MTQQRSNEEIRADLATEEGQGGARRLSPIGRLVADVEPLLARVEELEQENERLRGEQRDDLDDYAVDELPKALRQMAATGTDLREIAETYLYDGDTDQPLNDGYHALYVVAAGLSGLSLQEEQPTHLVGAGGWRACDTAADWAGSDTAGVTCAECLATTTDVLQEEQE